MTVVTHDEAVDFCRRMKDRVDTALFLVGRIKGVKAEIIPSLGDELTMGFQIIVTAASEADARRATELAFNAIAGRNETIIRIAVETDSRYDFHRMEHQYKGAVRFFIFDRVGPRYKAVMTPEKTTESRYLPAGSL